MDSRIYIVIKGFQYEKYMIMDVFSSLEKAQTFVEQYITKWTHESLWKKIKNKQWKHVNNKTIIQILEKIIQ